MKRRKIARMVAGTALAFMLTIGGAVSASAAISIAPNGDGGGGGSGKWPIGKCIKANQCLYR